ncbi:MAG: RNA 2',3'-cyclic phosphodiesterase [Bacillota bacterium]
MMRLFIAVDLTERQKKEVHILQQRLSGELGGVKWVREQGLHITLKFLGEVDPGRFKDLDAALSLVSSEAYLFQFCCGGVGVFPAPARAKVIWTGLREGAAALISVAALLETRLQSIGFPAEERPFRPHLTLGRLRYPLPVTNINRIIEQESAFGTEPAAAGAFTLYQSRLSRQGAIYDALRKYNLKENAGN